MGAEGKLRKNQCIYSHISVIYLNYSVHNNILNKYAYIVSYFHINLVRPNLRHICKSCLRMGADPKLLKNE